MSELTYTILPIDGGFWVKILIKNEFIMAEGFCLESEVEPFLNQYDLTWNKK
jgi:hypothetical protein